MDNLIGAQIGNIWDSGRSVFYAAAYLNIERAISIYSDMIVINNHNIDLITTMTSAKKNTLDGYSRYKLAAQIAGINSNYAAIINQLGGSTTRLNIKTSESFNLEADNIIKSITVIIKVNNDRANRLQDAFAKVLNSEGIRTRGNNPPAALAAQYTLEVNSFTNEVIYPEGVNKYKWCNIEVSVNLIENSTIASLLTFSFNDRVGNLLYDTAVNTAYLNAEKIIEEKFTITLREFLASLIPFN